MDFDIFVSKDGEFGQLHKDYASIDQAIIDFTLLCVSGEYARVTLYRYDTVLKTWSR